MSTRRKIVFEHDQEPDFSWLEQDMYNPKHPSYEPTYRTDEDMKAGREMNPEWYRNPENHVALSMLVYEMTDEDNDWRVVDSLGNIDFFADSDEWKTGTFYRLSDVPEGYLRELAEEAGLA
jgi:hypothetical protein